MKLKAFESITQGVSKILKRFPFSMIAALVGTASAYSLVHFDALEDEWSLYRVLMTSVLAFLLFGVIQLKLEREKFSKTREHCVKAAAVLFLMLYYWLLPNDFDFASSAFIIRFFLLSLALLFSVSFVPFVRHLKEINGFWQYNKTLFIRLFFTFVFTGSLYLGLVFALTAAKELLGIDFDERLFFEIWIIIVGLISTSFFLVGIPDKTSALEKKTDYYNGIKLFAQYVLIPLLLIYGVILYIYTGKILIQWNWPEGMVSWLVVLFSMVTILANFMLYPLLKKEKWVRIFSRISYALIIPMSVVLFLAFKIRVDEYGITEPRYYGVVLAFWFALTALYFVFSKKKNLIYLPLSLFIITIISSAGPLSSMDISKWSQMSRLERVLIENQILVDGKVQKAPGEVSKKDVSVISGSLDYIRKVHGYTVIQPWFEEDLRNYDENNECWNSGCVMELMGLDYLSPWEVFNNDRGTKYRSIIAEQGDPIPIEGYSELSEFYLSGVGRSPQNQPLGFDEKSLTVTYTDQEGSVHINIGPFLHELIKSDLQNRQWDYMRIDDDRIGLAFRDIHLSMDEDGNIEEVMGLNGYLLKK